MMKKKEESLHQNKLRESMLKILILTSSSYPHAGGLSSHIEALKKGLEEIGNEVDILSTSSMGLIYKAAVRVPIKILSNINGFIATFWYIFATKLLHGGYVFLKQITYGYDIICAQTVIAYNATYLVRKVFKTPVTLTIHHYLAYERPSEVGSDENYSRIKQFLLNEERKAYKSSDVIITVDSRLKKYLIESFGVNKNKIHVIINSVDIREFHLRKDKERFRKMFNLPEKKIIILCPRRLVKKNGVIYAALAMKYIKYKYKKNIFVLVYAGEGPEKDEIYRVAKQYNLVGDIVFLGSIEHHLIKYLYNAFDIVVIPSISIEGVEEATSISALEAMASGVPVIATKVGGLKEIIQDNVTGFLIEDKSPEALGDAIYKLSIMDTRDIVNNAREYVVENCSHIRKAREFLKLYKYAIVYTEDIGCQFSTTLGK